MYRPVSSRIGAHSLGPLTLLLTLVRFTAQHPYRPRRPHAAYSPPTPQRACIPVGDLGANPSGHHSSRRISSSVSQKKMIRGSVRMIDDPAQSTGLVVKVDDQRHELCFGNRIYRIHTLRSYEWLMRTFALRLEQRGPGNLNPEIPHAVLPISAALATLDNFRRTIPAPLRHWRPRLLALWRKSGGNR
jgi:hypothetical protein